MVGINVQNSILSSFISAFFKVFLNFFILVLVITGFSAETCAQSLGSKPWVGFLLTSLKTILIDHSNFALSIPLWLMSYIPTLQLGVKMWVFLFVEILAVLNFLSDCLEILLLFYQMGWIESALYLLLHSNNLLDGIMLFLPNSNSRILIRVMLWPFKASLLLFIKPAKFIIQHSISSLETRLQEYKNMSHLLDEDEFPSQTKLNLTQAESSRTIHDGCKKRNIDCVIKMFETKKQKVQVEIQKELEKAKGKEKMVMEDLSSIESFPSPSLVSSPSTSIASSSKSIIDTSSSSSTPSTCTSKDVANSESSEQSESLNTHCSVENSENQVGNSRRFVRRQQIDMDKLLAPVEEEKAEPTPYQAIQSASPMFPPSPMFHSGLFPEAGKNSVVLYTTSNPAKKFEVMASKHAIHLLKKFNLDVEVRDCFKRRSLEYDLKKLLGTDALPQLFGKGKYWESPTK